MLKKYFLLLFLVKPLVHCMEPSSAQIEPRRANANLPNGMDEPSSLYNLCIQFIVKNLDTLATAENKIDLRKIPEEVKESIFKAADIEPHTVASLALSGSSAHECATHLIDKYKLLDDPNGKKQIYDLIAEFLKLPKAMGFTVLNHLVEQKISVVHKLHILLQFLAVDEDDDRLNQIGPKLETLIRIIQTREKGWQTYSEPLTNICNNNYYHYSRCTFGRARCITKHHVNPQDLGLIEHVCNYEVEQIKGVQKIWRHNQEWQGLITSPMLWPRPHYNN